jgi:SagB-type dehydrogenase family enzyme
LDRASVSRLFFDSLALSAWKEAGGERWALRVNPSSGNLHPTEGYLVCGPVAGLTDEPMVAHYAPREHALEVRAEFSLKIWKRLTDGLTEDVLLVGLTSIHWREAWKYGERAYRYCQHDVGHAIASIALAAGGLGWRAELIDDVATHELADLLGVFDPQDAEAEVPDALLAVFPTDDRPPPMGIAPEVMKRFRDIPWQGEPNRLSLDHVDWEIIDTASEMACKPRRTKPYGSITRDMSISPVVARDLPFRRVVHRRRSAVAMDGRTEIGRDEFYRILQATTPAPNRIPFVTLPWSPRIDLLLFVHPRVREMTPGIYFVIRDPERTKSLRSALRGDYLWERPAGCPKDIDLFLLVSGDAQQMAGEISCHQAIAADGCFSLGMIADFDRSLREYGAWFYPRLYWECGLIGQVLYLEAEAAGIRGTGIGCFFDDPVHRLLGIEDTAYQSLYHFTLGGPLEDRRITTLPAYPMAGA